MAKIRERVSVGLSTEVNTPGRDLVTQGFHIPTPEEVMLISDRDLALIENVASNAAMTVVAEVKQHYRDNGNCVFRNRITFNGLNVSENIQIRILAKIKELMLGAGWYFEFRQCSGVAGGFYYIYTVQSLKFFHERQAAQKLSRRRKIRFWSCVGTALIMTLLGLLVCFA